MQDYTPAVRPQFLAPSVYRHGSTVGHLWGDV
jgi:hypothetical protein